MNRVPDPQVSAVDVVIEILRDDETPESVNAVSWVLERHPEQRREVFAHPGVLRRAAARPEVWALLVSLGADPCLDAFAVKILAQRGHESSLLSLIPQNAPAWEGHEHIELVATAAVHGLASFCKAWPLPNELACSERAPRLFWDRTCVFAERAEPPEFRRGMEALWERFPVDRRHPDFAVLLENFARLGHAPQGMLHQIEAEDAGQPAQLVGAAPFLLATALKARYSSVAHRLVREAARHPERWRDPEGKNQTLLHTVCGHARHWSPEVHACVQGLLRQGFDPNARDQEGCTPLHRAAATARPGPKSLLPLLLKAGGDLKAQNLRGQSVRDVVEHPKIRAWCEERLLEATTAAAEQRRRHRL